MGKLCIRAVMYGLILVLLSSCGGGGGNSGPGPNPVISSLLVRQATRGSLGAIRVDMATFDEQGDVFGGTCVVDSVPGGRAVIPISALQPGADPNSKSGSVFCVFAYRGRGVTVSAQVFVVDRAGNESNRLGFVFTSEGQSGDVTGPSVIEGIEGGVK